MADASRAVSPSVRRATDRDRSAWDDFVHSRALAGDGPVYAHLYGWRDVVAVYGQKSHYLLAENDGRLQGVLPLVLMSGPLASGRLVSMPYLDVGGSLATHDEVHRRLAEAALRLAANLGASGLDLRFASQGVHGGPPAEEPGASDRFRFVLDPSTPGGDLFARLGSKVRNQIRKALRSGLFTEPASVAELPAFYRVFAQNMRDLGSPVHHLAFFEAVFAQWPDQTRLFLTREPGGRVVAAAIELHTGTTRVVPWASALRQARPLCPNHSLYWRALESAREEGCDEFDFGRSSLGSGTFHFKSQWGARPVQLGWRFVDPAGTPQSEAFHSPARRALAGRVWKRLPVWLATACGSRLRGQLSE